MGGEIDEKLGFGSNSIKTFYGGFHIGALGVWSSVGGQLGATLWESVKGLLEKEGLNQSGNWIPVGHNT